ncbi:MAG: hypothetical protein ACPGES_01140 [Coraliomargarita sp.]
MKNKRLSFILDSVNTISMGLPNMAERFLRTPIFVCVYRARSWSSNFLDYSGLGVSAAVAGARLTLFERTEW